MRLRLRLWWGRLLEDRERRLVLGGRVTSARLAQLRGLVSKRVGDDWSPGFDYPTNVTRSEWVERIVDEYLTNEES